MTETSHAPRAPVASGPSAKFAPCAALDLGSNNCRLLIATPRGAGFRIVDAFSRIVRLGEGVSRAGRLNDAAMDRALGALKVCADRIRRHGVRRVRAVATQACRVAANGEDFVARVDRETGLKLEIISTQEEAHLSVAGCMDLLDPNFDVGLVLDVGGGSTELSWVDLRSGAGFATARRRPSISPRLMAWHSAPIGVVTLAERFPEPTTGGLTNYRAMVDFMKTEIDRFADARAFRDDFARGRGHIVGTSGAITSLASLHLDLPRYDRSRVDGLWMSREQCDQVVARLAALTLRERAAQPCIGPDRADLVLAGAAILQAVQELWPSERVRVADRGLREGLLLSLMRRPRGNTRRGRRAPTPAVSAQHT